MAPQGNSEGLFKLCGYKVFYFTSVLIYSFEQIILNKDKQLTIYLISTLHSKPPSVM